MAAIPQAVMAPTAAAIMKAYEDDAEDGRRPHLGASKIGHSCERHLWYVLRWAESEKLEGRKLRLFETGHLEEPRIVRNLRRIGVEVHDVDPATGDQWRVWTHGGHFGGSMDSAAIGFPEAPKTWHVGEFKTSNDKGFQKMLKEGVKKSKPMHYAQMQTYMGLTGMTRSMYVMVNKNDDAVYTERIEFDQVEYSRILAKAERIITATEPPMRAHAPDWWECKFCEHREICHGEQVPEVNCRTCANSTPVIDSSTDRRWTCALANADISIDMQRTGCSDHRYIPILLEKAGRQVDYVNGDVIYEAPDGRKFANGEGPAAFTSHEIRKCGGKQLLPDLAELKADVAKQLAKVGVVASTQKVVA